MHECARARTYHRLAFDKFAALLRKNFFTTGADKHFFIILSFPKNDEKRSFLCKQPRERAFKIPRFLVRLLGKSILNHTFLTQS